MIGSNQIPSQPNPYYQPQGVQPPPAMPQQRPVYPPQTPPQPLQPVKPTKAEKEKKPKVPMVSFYPHIYLAAFIIHMVGLIVIFIGVFLIVQNCIDLGNDDFPTNWFEDLGHNIQLLAVGGMIYAGGTVTRGVARFFDGQMDMRDRIKF